MLKDSFNTLLAHLQMDLELGMGGGKLPGLQDSLIGNMFPFTFFSKKNSSFAWSLLAPSAV